MARGKEKGEAFVVMLAFMLAWRRTPRNVPWGRGRDGMMQSLSR